MRKILTIVIVVLHFISCDDKIYFNIPQKEKPLLSNGDTACFLCNDGVRIDSFIVRITDDYEVSDKRYYDEMITWKYENIDRIPPFFNFHIVHVKTTSVSVDGYYFPTMYNNENTIDMDINGINYESVYVLQRDNSPDTIPYRVYYSHKYGIIQYEYSDTLKFVIKN